MPPPDKITSEADAVAAIEAAGYTNVANLEQRGATWHASATDSSGAQVRIVIDGAGKVHEKGAEDEPQPEPKA